MKEYLNMKILQIKTSILSQYSVSNGLSDELVAQLLTNNEGATSQLLDFETTKIPHVDGQLLTALSTEAANRSEEQHQLVNFADSLIEQLKASDVMVLGMPMYNFNVPSMLSSYFDHIARAGVTFRYTDQGPVGLLESKKVYVLATRGGIHQGLASDTQTPYIKQMLGFVGISDVDIIYVEGLGMGDEAKDAAIAKAKVEINQLSS